MPIAHTTSCPLHHLPITTASTVSLLLVLGPCSLLLHVYILVLLCGSGVFTLSIGEWPLAITVTRGLERLHCTKVILLPFYLCLDFDLGQLTTSVHRVKVLYFCLVSVVQLLPFDGGVASILCNLYLSCSTSNENETELHFLTYSK